jgi:hypothetical protein
MKMVLLANLKRVGHSEGVWIYRDEVMGTEGTIWINSFLRTGFEAFTSVKAVIISLKNQNPMPDGFSL